MSQIASSPALTLQHLPTNLALCDPPDATIGYEAVLQGAQVCYMVASSHVHLMISKIARMPGYYLHSEVQKSLLACKWGVGEGHDVKRKLTHPAVVA